jgi:cytochrome c556
MMLEHEMANMRDHLATLGKVTGRCVACHAAYRLH